VAAVTAVVGEIVWAVIAMYDAYRRGGRAGIDRPHPETVIWDSGSRSIGHDKPNVPALTLSGSGSLSMIGNSG
jgi:hypothetical protein